MRIDVDLSTVTLGEIEKFESDAGMEWDEFTAGKSGVRATLALICLQERRRIPDYTMDDARAVKLADIEIVEEEPSPPTPRKRAAKTTAS